MKYILFIGVLIFTSGLFISAKKASGREEGIVFFKGTWKEAIQKAKKENKPIFLDIYATWCGPCKMLERNTFSDKEAAAFYNQSFINVSLDGEKSEGALLAEKYRIRGYPTLLYFDKSGTPVFHTDGYMGPDELISIGKKVLNKIK